MFSEVEACSLVSTGRMELCPKLATRGALLFMSQGLLSGFAAGMTKTGKMSHFADKES